MPLVPTSIPAAWRLPLQLGLGLLVCLISMGAPVPPEGFVHRSYLAHLPMPTTAAWNAPQTFPPLPVALEPGIGAYLETSIPHAAVPQAFATLEKLPLKWVRTEIPWAGVEPQRGQFAWERWDGVVAGLQARRYRTLGMLCYWTHWVDPYSDAAIDDFGKYAERVARRYRGRVAAWEVWNEPNERTYWQSTPERYVRLLRAAYEGVKRGDPNAVVVGGSFSGVDLIYLRTLLKLGAASYMDYLSVHPYSFGWNPEDAHLVAELRGMAQELRKVGMSDRLWVTEIGINLTGEARHANLLQRTWLLLQQSGVVDKLFWFTLYNPGSPTYPLYRADWSPKPSVEALEQTVGRLGPSLPQGSALPADLQAPWISGTPHALSPLQAWWFQAGKRRTLCVWSSVGTVDCSAAPQHLPATMTSNPYWHVAADGSW